MQNAVLKNRPQQGDVDNANEDGKIWSSASVWISVRGSTIATSEHDVRPVGPLCSPSGGGDARSELVNEGS